MALAAEEVGFDALFVPDHLLFRQSPTDNAIQVEMPAGKTHGAWEAWTVLCALAAAISRIEFGPFVACNSFRNPALLAKMAVTLDEVSDGRLVLGIGAGDSRATGDGCGWRVNKKTAEQLPGIAF